MAESKEPKERLAAILAADAVGYSRLMREDDRATVATLDEFRGIFRHWIEAHNGRIVDMAGDSVLAIFESAISAVTSATEAQAELAKRNEALPEDRKMLFRVGLNLGDILEKDDGSIYGDGVNVAARLQAMASPGGINVSGTVFDSVRAKVGGPFAFMGEQELKNIADPVAVYQFGVAGQSRPANREPAAKDGEAPPTVAVAPVKVISGGAEIASLAEGLQQDIIGGLTKQTAIAVIGEHAGAAAEGADFRLEGSVRAAGDRLRLSFTLAEGAGGSQVWSDRYDRNLDDVFDLEDEISMSVAAAVRIRIKAKAFEKLRNTVNEALSVPQLLSKAAGYFVSSYGHNDEALETLKAALERKPDNAMAMAMMVFCRYRMFEFCVLDMPADVKEELSSGIKAALSADPSSFFAHLIAAMIQQDLRGDFDAALVHAETSLELNSSFSQATAMTGIAKFHLGEQDEGLQLLQNGIQAAPEDPHRFRHQRELALAHFIVGDEGRAAQVVGKLVRQAPDLLRNHLISVPILWHAGQQEAARKCVQELLAGEPTLSRGTLRPVHFHDAAMAARFAEGYGAAGLPD